MSQRQPFRLQVDSQLKCAKTIGNAIVYGPLSVVKLEAGRLCNVLTGIRIRTCSPSGSVVVSPAEEFTNMLKFGDSTFSAQTDAPITIEIKNLTKQFIRIEPTQCLFKFEFVEHAMPVEKTKKVAAKKVIKKEEPKEEVKKAEPKKEEPKEDKKEETIVEEPKEDEKEELIVGDSSMEESKTEEPTVDEQSQAKGKRKQVQKKKRVSV